MNRCRTLPVAFAAAAVIFAIALSTARAVPLAVANHSFESPAFANANYAFLISHAQQGGYGWTMSDGAFIYNPQAGDYTGAGAFGTPQGALGAQVGGVTSGDYAMFQRLAGADVLPGNGDDPVVEVGTVYTITFSVGQPPLAIPLTPRGAVTTFNCSPA